MGHVHMQAMHASVGGGVTPRLMALLLALAGDAAGAAALAASIDRGTADSPEPGMAYVRSALVARCAELLAAPVRPALLHVHRLNAPSPAPTPKPEMANYHMGCRAWPGGQTPWRYSLAVLLPPAPCAAPRC